MANGLWNAGTPRLESRPEPPRMQARKAQPRPAAHDARHCPAPELHGEVRPPHDPRSSLYNTDGQIFSDAGIPVVLFMENYDINRQATTTPKTRWPTSTWTTARPVPRLLSKPSRRLQDNSDLMNITIGFI